MMASSRKSEPDDSGTPPSQHVRPLLCENRELGCAQADTGHPQAQCQCQCQAASAYDPTVGSINTIVMKQTDGIENPRLVVFTTNRLVLYDFVIKTTALLKAIP